MSGITEQSMVHLTGKDDWGTPQWLVQYIEEKYAKCKFEIDACASDYNFKVPFYFTEQVDMFKQQLDRPFFMNPIYGKKGMHSVWKTHVDAKSGKTKFDLDENGKRIKIGEFYNKYGTEDFLKFAHYMHFKHNVTGAVLLFANVSSSEYFEQVVGEFPENRKHNECELFFPPKRIVFEDHGKPVGTPSLSSIVVVYDERFGARK